MSGRVVICGAVAQKPYRAGHAWQFLQYLLGFRRLGWDVLFVDALEGDVPTGDRRVEYVRAVFAEIGLPDAWTIRLDGGVHAGLSRSEALDRIRGSDLLVNVMGFCADVELLDAAPLRVFLDTDPGFGQMWSALGLADVFAGHDRHVTIAERIGRPGCTVPLCGIDWITTRQPVVLDAWPAVAAPVGTLRFSTIASWRGAYAPVEYRGHRYGLRAHELRRFVDLPTLTGSAFELALDIHPGDAVDRSALEAAGWTLVDPGTVASGISSYRDYIGSSSAELMAAKGMYVDTQSGWFSERSACYLASGRPVVVQDTGLADLYPTGRGLLTFRTIEDAVRAVESVAADYQQHVRAARELAESHFDSDLVLTSLLERIGEAPLVRSGSLAAAGR